ncbi:hypothetical protein C0991_000714, partial [Blastosporella zonata]
DTAPDVYETEDVLSSTQTTKDAEEEEEPAPQRGVPRTRNDAPSKEEIDSSNLIDPEEASRRFRKAERKYVSRTHYTYPPSPTDSEQPSGRAVPLSARLRSLQAELVALEGELADPSNPQLAKEREVDNVDPGELIRGLVDVRGRLDKIRKGKEGRAKLVGSLISDEAPRDEDGDEKADKSKVEVETNKPEARRVAEMDRRVGELEKLVGSSSASLDETSPLPPPLLPLLTRLNIQLTLLSQPRHLDSISRRLKLLLSDLERVSSTQSQSRHPPSPSAPSEQLMATTTLLPLLTRLSPALPQIPHILTRLRTLATLHTSAADFHATLEGLEEKQRKTHEALLELEGAVSRVEGSLQENRGVVQGNVAGLESRVNGLLGRLEELTRPSMEDS